MYNNYNKYEVKYLQSVVLEEDTGVGINVGPWVLGLSLLGQDARDNLEDLGDELEEGVVGQVLEGKLTLRSVTGVSLTEDSVSESRDNTASVESLPDNLSESLVGDRLVSKLLLEIEGPGEHFLVGKSVEGSSKTVETSGEGEVRVGEGTSNKVSGVGRDVSSLVVTVDHEVETHEVIKLGLLLESELAGKVGSPVKAGVSGNELSVLVGVLVDGSCNSGQLGCEGQVRDHKGGKIAF